MSVAASPFPGQDLRLVLEGAIGAEGQLLTAGEVRVVERILALPDDALELYARLSARQPRVFRLAELAYAGDVAAQARHLVDDGLAHAVVPDDRCLPAFTADELRAACRRLGLDARGARPALEARLAGQRWVNEPVLLLAHLRLLRRLEILFFQTPHVRRQDLVLDRVGAVRWPAYTPTGGLGLFPNRAAMRCWERARRGAWLPGDVDDILRRGRTGAQLDPWSYAVEAEVEALALLPATERASALQARLEQGVEVRVPLLRALEQAGDRDGALRVAVAGQGNRSAEALACARTARRLARALRRPVPPVAELAPAPVRRVTVRGGPLAGEASRPRWPGADGRPVTVERAVMSYLAALGRPALHAEQTPWVGLYALLFADLYFLPVPGMLPGRLRTGPVDVGTPAFYLRLRDVIDERLDRVSRFGMMDYSSGWSGERLSGLWNPAAAQFLASHADGPMIACIVGRLAREGWRAAPGLPDLFVTPGARVRLELTEPEVSAIPGNIGEKPFLVEIKGPTDALRDEQRIWLDILVGSGIHVELWELT